MIIGQPTYDTKETTHKNSGKLGRIQDLWKGVHMYKGVGVHLADYLIFFSSPEPKTRGELIGCDSSRDLSVHPCVCPFILSNMNISLRPAVLSRSNLIWNTIVVGVDCIRFRTRSGKNSGFHGNR